MRRLIVLGVVLTVACLAERGPFTNRMAQSGTSYLARAARQPVNWQPWGREAFALASRLDRPVLLYVGDDACHWCAETDRAIYTDPEIGSVINELFVPVRLDRDERPDVAQRYQVAVERLAGLHGWPLTVFLTPDGSPFFGGTYFPADDPITGRGLKQLLPEIAKRYHDQRPFIMQQAAVVRQFMLTSEGGGGGGGESRGVLRAPLVRDGIARVNRELDAAVQARATANSVVHVEAVSLLLTEYARARDTAALAVARRALDLMLDTTNVVAGDDAPRLVRAALVSALAQGWVVTGDARYRESGRELVAELARVFPVREVFADQQAFIIENAMLASATLDEPAVESSARAALDLLLQNAYAKGWGVRHSATMQPGLLRDQVQVASACLAAHQLTGDKRYLDVAVDLAAILESRYADSMGGYFDAVDPVLGDQTKQVLDDVLPGANAAAARFLARLSTVTQDAVYRRRAQATLEAFAGTIPDAGLRATTFLAAARETLGAP